MQYIERLSNTKEKVMMSLWWHWCHHSKNKKTLVQLWKEKLNLPAEQLLTFSYECH